MATVEHRRRRGRGAAPLPRFVPRSSRRPVISCSTAAWPDSPSTRSPHVRRQQDDDLQVVAVQGRARARWLLPPGRGSTRVSRHGRHRGRPARPVARLPRRHRRKPRGFGDRRADRSGPVRSGPESRLSAQLFGATTRPGRLDAGDRQGTRATPPDLDSEAVVDQLWGACYHRLLLPDQPLTEEFVDALVENLFGGIAP